MIEIIQNHIIKKKTIKKTHKQYKYRQLSSHKNFHEEIRLRLKVDGISHCKKI